MRAIQLDAAPPPKPLAPVIARDAMAALRTVQSIAVPGAIHAEYTQAVSDAGFAVDRYLRDPKTHPPRPR